MPIDFTEIQLDDNVIDGIDESAASWKPASEFPPTIDPATYRVMIKQIRDTRQKETVEGPRLVISYDLEILDGPMMGRSVNFQWASNVEYSGDRGKTSTLLDMVKSAGVQGPVRTNLDFGKILNKMEGNAEFCFKAQVDWRGSCQSCYKQKLMELTGDETPELAQLHATKKHKDEANTFALKLRNSRQFPVRDDDPTKRKDVVVCPDCGDDIRARANVSRFYPVK